MIRYSFGFFAIFFVSLFFAQVPFIEVANDKNEYKNSNDVILQKLDIDVKVVGGISTTVTTMVFQNNSNRILEGRLTFPLPEGVSVSGYALDINGKLRNAVPVEKEKAKEVFETIEKRRVDPGIIEKVEGNNFRTRIYPINPKSSRTIQISYHSELKVFENNAMYFLPLTFQKAIPDFNLKVLVSDKINTPQLIEKPDGSFDFVKDGNQWTAEIEKKDFLPLNNLKINIPKSQNTAQSIFQKASNNHFYFYSGMDLKPTERPKKTPSKISIVWDNSLSGLHRDHKKEFDLLNEYFKVVKSVSVDVYFLNATFEEGQSFKINNSDWWNLRKYLENCTYDGGTDFSQLKEINSDEILLFSDGISSFGDFIQVWKKPIYTIVASPKANFSAMKSISNNSGGEFINLNENEPIKEVRKLLFQPLKFLGFKENKEVSEVYPSLPKTVDNYFSISGILNQKNTKLILKFGYGNQVTEEREILLDSENQVAEDWDISKFWAQNKIDELEISETDQSEEIKNLGKQFGIVTQNTSLMVLENLDDYIRYKITPPEELLADYNRITKERLSGINEERKEIMADAEAMIEELKKWWNTDFSKKKSYPKPIKNEENRAVVETSDAALDVSVTPTPNRSPQPAVVEEVSANHLEGRVAGVAVADSANATIEEVVVVGYGSAKKENDFSQTIVQNGSIKTMEVKSNEEYMKFFENKNAEKIYEEYLKQRPNYIETPSYYFDVAQLLYSKNDKKTAFKVLSSIADLDLENEELYKLLAYKLKQTENYDKELWISKKVLDWRPFDPQSYRDYALALENNGNYQEALDNLYKILTLSYTQQIANRDDGIEEVVLMELNELISRYKKNLNIGDINPKLIADLPVNIRVVLNWNKDNTDIDLWVTDPNGEKCFYSNNETEIGGRLSNDFTEGFGPEQFLLKKAIKGKYKIETNFFGENQVSISGPTTLMAEIFINYATGKQERKVVVFQNKKGEDNTRNEGVLIAEFEF